MLTSKSCSKPEADPARDALKANHGSCRNRLVRERAVGSSPTVPRSLTSIPRSDKENGRMTGFPKEQFRDRDVYLDYDFEDVMFRFEHSTRHFFRKFYGESEEKEVPFDNRLLNDAILGGTEIDAKTYQEGKPRQG